MRVCFISLILMSFLVSNVQALVINEVMPNPLNESNEWIEIYNPENIELNLSDWMVSDENYNDSLFFHNSTLLNSTYFLIVGEDANISEITEYELIYFRTTNGKIGNGLRNEGENITIHNSTSLIDQISYPDFSYKEGYSWSLAENVSWLYCDSPTPGKPNFLTNTSVNQTDGNQTNITNETCDLSLSITSDLILISGEKHIYYLNVEDETCDQSEKEVSIEYWITDLFGETIKSPYTTTQVISCSKNISRQWTPKGIEGSEAFYIIANITNSTCNDSDHSNDLAEKLIVVKGEKHDPKECPPCETKETACSCGPCSVCPSENKEEKEEEEFRIVSCPEEIGKNEEIEIGLEIKNILDQEVNYTVYSYVYEGNKILSTGFDGNSWLNTWDANKMNVSIPGNSSVIIELKNRVAEDTDPGKYRLRVRIWDDKKKHDLTREISINEPVPEPADQETEDENETSYIPGPENGTGEPEIPTGRIISRTEENWFSNFMESMINFFKNLFNL